VYPETATFGGMTAMVTGRIAERKATKATGRPEATSAAWAE